LRPFVADPARLKAAERRCYPRYALDLPGRFMRADKLDYPCRLKDISVAGAAMTTPTILTVGEKLIVYLLHLGGLEGTVVRRFEGGFAMSISATQRKREKLGAQILRLSEQSVIPETEERQHPRLPGNQISTLVLSDGTRLECLILDLSRSGASVATPARPAIGSEVVLSNERAAVVRHHEEGIAVEFINQRLEDEAAFERYRRSDGFQR
jgi:PilZ domain